MLKLALALCAKDLRIVLARSAGLAQALLLGLLLVFLFSLSLEAGDRLSPQAAAETPRKLAPAAEESAVPPGAVRSMKLNDWA